MNETIRITAIERYVKRIEKELLAKKKLIDELKLEKSLLEEEVPFIANNIESAKKALEELL